MEPKIEALGSLGWIQRMSRMRRRLREACAEILVGPLTQALAADIIAGAVCVSICPKPPVVRWVRYRGPFLPG